MIINMNGAKAPETPSSVLQEKTVTPETLPTVIGPDEGYDGLTQVTVNPDSQLTPTNIRSGKTIFGVEGSFVGETVGSETIDPNDLSGYSPSSYINNAFQITNFQSQVFEVTSIGEPTEGSFAGLSHNNIVYKQHDLVGLFSEDSLNLKYNSSSFGTYWFETEITIPEGDYSVSCSVIPYYINPSLSSARPKAIHVSPGNFVTEFDSSVQKPLVIPFEGGVFNDVSMFSGEVSFKVHLPEIIGTVQFYSYSQITSVKNMRLTLASNFVLEYEVPQ